MKSFEKLNNEFNRLALLDEEFLVALQAQKERELYAKVSALNFEELPIESIEGRISDGSINIDGTSAIRRTCSLTMVTDELDINDVYWGIKTKVKIEVGIKNELEGGYGVDGSRYPEIIWFPQGIYILTSFNTSIQLKGYSISLQGKDKMSMLNGDLGGQLFASVDFGSEEIETKSFSKVALSDTNSDVLISGNYYIEGVSEGEFPTEIFITTPSTDMKYSFEEYNLKEEIEIPDGADEDDYSENVEGLYYKINGFYRLIKNKDLNTQKLKKYKIYQKVTHPSQMFEYIGEGNGGYIVKSGDSIEYEKGKYYYSPEDRDDSINSTYSNTEAVYTIDYATTASFGRSYWRLKSVYRLELHITKTKIPLEKIIREAVHAYALEPYHNIIINDLDNYGLEQLTYKGDTDLVAIQRISDGEFSNLGFKDKIHYWVWLDENTAYQLNGSDTIMVNNEEEIFTVDHLINKADLINGNRFIFSQLGPLLTETPTKVYAKNPCNDDISTYYEKNADGNYVLTSDQTLQINKTYYTRTVKNGKVTYSEISNPAFYLAIIKYGDDIGYRITDLTYTGDLVTSLGDSLTSVLDKIKDMLGEFEYFYDLNGHFVFQQKKNYVNIAWTQLVDNQDEDYVTYANDTTKFSFSFEGNKLITAISNSPQLSSVRNDFSIWGKRTTLSGEEYPIHARYAIDKKPKEYMAFNGTLYYTQEAKNNPSPYYADLIKDDVGLPTTYQKNMNIIPSFLKKEDQSSDWWELMDWANYYKSKTGVFPTYTLMQYCSEGFNGSLTIGGRTYNFSSFARIVIDLDAGDDNTTMNDPESWVPYTRPLKLGVNTTLSWNPFQHGYHGCGHTYAQYRLWYDMNSALRTFIYKPQLPNSQVIDIDGGSLNDDLVMPDKPALLVDWRELIYRMAIDYFDAQGCSEDDPIYNKDQELVISSPDHFLGKVAELNPYYYPTGYTGYEQYYTDMQGFWRQLYNPDYLPQLKWRPGRYDTEIVTRPGTVYKYKTSTWNSEEPIGFNVDYYFCPSESAFVNKQEREYFDNDNGIYRNKSELKDEYYRYLIKTSDQDENFHRRYWNVNVVEAPESLNFWIDFLDDVNEVAQFSIPMIGDRSMTVQEDRVKAIAYKDIPGLIVVSRDTADDNSGDAEKAMWQQAEGPLIDQIKAQSGYTFVWLPKGMSQFFTISYRSLSAKTKIEQLLYKYSYCPENITITALPIYHLEPNTRIYVRDETTKINGEYIISKITLPLDHKGTMQIQASKAPSRII